MKIYGLDFTSAPIVSVPPRSSDKRLIVADCELAGSVLTVRRFIPLTGDKNTPFAKLEKFLSNENETWTCGVDFPLGMPIGAIDYFGWCKEEDPAKWEYYVRRIHKCFATADEFSAEVEEWTKLRLSGEAVRVFFFDTQTELHHLVGALRVAL